MSTHTTAVVGVIESRSIRVLDIRGSSIFLDKVIEVFDRTIEQLAISESVHHGIVMKCLRNSGWTANAQTLDIFRNSHNYVFIVLGRYSLDILWHEFSPLVVMKYIL